MSWCLIEWLRLVSFIMKVMGFNLISVNISKFMKCDLVISDILKSNREIFVVFKIEIIEDIYIYFLGQWLRAFGYI